MTGAPPPRRADPNSSPIPLPFPVCPPVSRHLPTEARVVVAGEELFLLVKSKWMYVFSDDVDFSKAFCVNHRSTSPAWQELTSIGERALFVDPLHGFAVGTAGFTNLESNTVYSVTTKEASRSSSVKYSVSAFNLQSRTSKKLACRLNELDTAQRGGAAASWIIPSVNEG
uniref:KIB1-4 beta-propeller domain-containing protein n=1 Tax=Aegilops tauschii TaxID=37682 RepID=M8AYA1_AEGTA